MKKWLFVFLLFPAMVFAQQNATPQKFALVIGNADYTGISKHNNPVNDAADVAAALQGMGFSVDTVLNGDLDKMENAIDRYISRLSGNKETYGFFYYAGHGVQANGENYLIPVAADGITSNNHLRQRAVSVQTMLSNIERSGNELNIFVLDACRDNPFGWARSTSRGLTVVSAPSGSIIMYATSANNVASDGNGRNGLFTSQLLNNLKTPGLSVRELFDKTGEDVLRASQGRQHPELSIRYFGANAAYLGSKPELRPGTAGLVAPSQELVFGKPRSGNLSPREDQWFSVRSAASGLLVVETTGSTNTLLDVYDNSNKLIASADDGGESARIDLNAAADTVYYVRVRAYAGGSGPYNISVTSPAQARIHYSRGETFRTGGDYSRAITEYSEAIWLYPNYTDAYIKRAVIYTTQKDFNRAIADYTQAIRLEPTALRYAERGSLYRDSGGIDPAIADYSAAIRLEPTALHYSERGLMYREKGDLGNAIADYTELLRLEPTALRYNERGLMYRDTNDLDRAIADYTQAIRLEPTALRYNERGEMHREKGDLDYAIADYSQAIRLEPTALRYNERGLMYREKNDLDYAIADYTEVIRLEPTALRYNERGLMYREKNDFDHAIADYTQAIRLEPTALRYNERGEMYRSLNDRTRAIADYTEAIDMEPTAPRYYERGLMYRESGNLDYAIADYTEVIRMEPTALHYYERGEMYRDQNDLNRAIADYSQVIRLDPAYTDAYSRRGYAFLRQEDYSRAIADYNAVLRLNPGADVYGSQSNAFFLRGETRQVKKNRNLAMADYKAALRFNPDNADAERNLETIRHDYLPKYSGLGASFGTSFNAPQIVGTVRGLFAPARYSFWEIGFDIGAGNAITDANLSLFYPYTRYALYLPAGDSFAWYAGAGGGLMVNSYTYMGVSGTNAFFALDAVTGFVFFNFLDLSFSLRTNFAMVMAKMAAGFVVRF